MSQVVYGGSSDKNSDQTSVDSTLPSAVRSHLVIVHHHTSDNFKAVFAEQLTTKTIESYWKELTTVLKEKSVKSALPHCRRISHVECRRLFCRLGMNSLPLWRKESDNSVGSHGCYIRPWHLEAYKVRISRLKYEWTMLERQSFLAWYDHYIILYK